MAVVLRVGMYQDTCPEFMRFMVGKFREITEALVIVAGCHFPGSVILLLPDGRVLRLGARCQVTLIVRFRVLGNFVYVNFFCMHVGSNGRFFVGNNCPALRRHSATLSVSQGRVLMVVYCDCHAAVYSFG